MARKFIMNNSVGVACVDFVIALVEQSGLMDDRIATQLNLHPSWARRARELYEQMEIEE